MGNRPMPRKIRKHREYRFQIDAFTPETMPMSRLAEYLADLSIMLGQDKSVHLMKVEKGSTVPVLLVEWEAEPKLRDRIRLVKRKEAPEEAMQAARKIDQRLAQDNAIGNLVDPVGSKVYHFPGREGATRLEFGPVNQQGMLQGIPIRVGGELDTVQVHLEDGKEKYIVLAKRPLAKEMAQYLFTTVIRVEGTARWIRHRDGEWEMLAFHASSYKIVEDADLKKNVDDLRGIPGDWKKLDDPLAVLREIKQGVKPQ